MTETIYVLGTKSVGYDRNPKAAFFTPTFAYMLFIIKEIKKSHRHESLLAEMSPCVGIIYIYIILSNDIIYLLD